MEVAFGIMNREWFDPRRFDFKLLKELLAIAIPLLPNFLIYWVFNSCDKVMITNMIGISLTEKQQKVWMNFIREDKSYAKYYDEFVVLLGTGMRVSEFCGLTLQDLDFQNRRIRVDHQLIRESGGKYYVEKTKTECGRRFIPMTEGVFQACRTCLQIANG